MELWKEDLQWSFSLIKQRTEQDRLQEEETMKTNVKVTEITEQNEDAMEAQKMLNQGIISTQIDKYQSNQTSEMKNLPQNYVCMRDKWNT